MIEKKASVHWEGRGKAGKGEISTETGALSRIPYGFAQPLRERSSRHQSRGDPGRGACRVLRHGVLVHVRQGGLRDEGGRRQGTRAPGRSKAKAS